MDATVVAVIDFNMVPYHWDFLASKMPQQTDSTTSNDLPLDRAPHEWLPGFPDPKKSFSSYNRFDLTLDEKNPDSPIQALDAADKPEWDKVQKSTFDDVNYYWFPGTKVIGGIEFGSNKLHGTPNDHGAGVTSVSVGNIHGACPECLLVFINLDDGDTADAIRWAMAQPWIDVVTNSYGRSNVSFVAGGTKMYHGPDVPDQKKASERGQTIFFSAGNGMENAYTAANNTYMSSEKGPDWLITVGAVSPHKDDENQETSGSNASYLGAGKPVDVAGLGDGYPSAYSANSVGSTGTTGFSGTSNAAPTLAGTYARGLYTARKILRGPSRTQKGDVIATGSPIRCGSARKKCELGDGELTATELRNRLLLGAIHTPAGMTAIEPGASTPPIGEEEFLNEGHGTYIVRSQGVKAWLEEFRRFFDPLIGAAKELARPEGEAEWFVVDSFCRQEIWGPWSGGLYKEGTTDLPGQDPDWPIRSSLEQSCPQMQPPPP